MIIDPVLFHLHHLNETEDIPFWSRLAKELGGPNLELGCGTGRLIMPLTKAGHLVVGLDINFQALTFLKNTMNSSILNRILVFQSDLEEFHLGIKFSLIFLACNTLSTLPKNTRRKAYQRIFEHLRYGGIFAASFPNPAYLESLPVEGEIEIEDTLIHPSSGNPIQISSGWERLISSVVFRWHYDQLHPDGQVMRETVETEHSLNSVDEYLAELTAEKLIPIQMFGDYRRSEFQQDSPYAIILARKAD
ncbi:MAG: class I SAM-dependent methyltransferase [Anaerolineales bacterium]|nr:class I SAM-dependent methyltransferase [Anaerolineales bacterium]